MTNPKQIQNTYSQNIYQCKANLLSGTTYIEVLPAARKIFRYEVTRTKRRPYIRSTYFDKEKIFINHFWDHLMQKSWSDRARRLRYLPCAIELIRHSSHEPITKENVNKPSELVHRFLGLTSNTKPFAVQIKENKRNGRKDFLSVFPLS